MRKTALGQYLTLILFLGTGSQTIAEAAQEFDPFNLPFGSEFPMGPHPHSPKDDFPIPVAVKGFDVPMPSKAELPMFYEYSVQIVADSGAIYSVIAKRTYPSLELCMADRDKALDTVQKRMTGLKTESGSLHSDKFQVDVSCAYKSEDRFVALNFCLFHKPTQDKIRIPDYSGYKSGKE